MQDRILHLREVALQLRKLTIDSLYKAQSGHAGAALSIIDILAALYFDEMTFTEDHRDRFVLSKGHAVTALYAVFAEMGWLDHGELESLRSIDSRLQGHPDRTRIPQLDAGTGALGQGPSIAIGYALSAKMEKSEARSYCIVGDGECQEGQIWEAAMYAAARKLDNLMVIIDVNGFQNEKSVIETLPIGSLKDKWQSFGWHVFEIDGHDFQQILQTYTEAKKIEEKPSVLIAHTVKGKGVEYMENNNAWHSKLITDSEYEEAMAFLTNPI